MKTRLFNKVYATYATTVNVKFTGKTKKIMGCKEEEILIDNPVEYHHYTALLDGIHRVNSYIGYGLTNSGDWAIIQNGFNNKVAWCLYESEQECKSDYLKEVEYFENAKTTAYTKLY